MDIIPSDLATYGKDAKSLLKELQSQNERMFMLTMLIMNTLSYRHPPCADNQLHGDFCTLYHPGAVPGRKGIPVLRPERSFKQPDHG